MASFIEYAKKSGPGWIQAAVTLGGGSLVGALYLGVIGAYRFLWLQPLAMLCGIVMLGAISHVTLSTGERPFVTVKRTISPVLAWAWLIATIIADVVFCTAQFSLGRSVMEQNLGAASWPPFLITGLFAIVGFSLVALTQRGGRPAKTIDHALKFMVAIVVLAFMGVVLKLLSVGQIPISEVFSGFVPDFSALFRPTDAFSSQIAQTGTQSLFWNDLVESRQRDVILTAFGTAVGINMTFLLPYNLLAKGWGKKERSLSRFDLGFGLFVPFVLATSFLVIAAASQFSGKTRDVFDAKGNVIPSAQTSLSKILKQRLHQEVPTDLSPAAYIAAAREKLPEAEFQLAASLVERDSGALSASLEPFLGQAARPIFGIGVLAMAVSTFVVHMLMNGYAVSEAFGKHGNPKYFLAGAALPALAGFFTPLFYAKAGSSLMVPASVIATSLLPIAYLTFTLLMNSRQTLGESLPKNRLLINSLLFLSLAVTTLGCIWVLSGKGTPGLVGLAALSLLAILGLVGFVKRSRSHLTS